MSNSLFSADHQVDLSNIKEEDIALMIQEDEKNNIMIINAEHAYTESKSSSAFKSSNSYIRRLKNSKSKQKTSNCASVLVSDQRSLAEYEGGGATQGTFTGASYISDSKTKPSIINNITSFFSFSQDDLNAFQQEVLN